MVLLEGPSFLREALFLMSEVPLWFQHQALYMYGLSKFTLI